MTPNDILKVEDVAALLDLDPSTVRRYWARFGGRKFGRNYRIRRDVLDRFLGGGDAV